VNQKKDSRPCIFCGAPGETDEHVVPKWLLRHFDLFDERLLLWNGTTIPYRQVVVPACLRCNHDRLAPLEQRVQEGSATTRDYYLWALKIMHGLGHRDAALPAKREKPAAGPLLPADVADDMGDLVRAAFRSLDNRAFAFSPDPFGSVMFIDSSRRDFMLIDVPRPYRLIAIALPRDQHLVVLPLDRGVVAKVYGRKPVRKRLLLEVPGLDGHLQLAMKLFGMLIFRAHLLIPREIVAEDEALVAAQVPRKLPTRHQSLELYRAIARMLRLPMELADRAHANYGGAGVVRWR